MRTVWTINGDEGLIALLLPNAWNGPVAASIDAQALLAVRPSQTDAGAGSVTAPQAGPAGGIAPLRLVDPAPVVSVKPGDHGTDYGVGSTVRTAVPVITTVPATAAFSNQDINGILAGSAWGAGAGAQTLTFSFPTAASQYGTGQGSGAGQYDDPAPFHGFQVLSDAQKNVVRYALKLISSYTGLSFTEITETDTVHAQLRYAGSSSPPTSYAYYPATTATAGDAFFGNIRNDVPLKAGYAFDTFLHEIGHNMGLKHGQQADATYGVLPDAHNSTEWSIMTYYSYVGTPDDFYSNKEGSGEQTYMMDDIAALQYLYGPNFNTNATATTYTWSPTTGEMFVNGLGQGASSTNTIFETLWDGNGTDTYDLSNYTTNLSIDLGPGEWSTFSTAQLADLDGYTDLNTHFAHGNIANADLYNGDVRSLIENATGGSGNDSITGNFGDNLLIGGGGDDILNGLGGNDTLIGGEGADTLRPGDGVDIMVGGAGADTFIETAGGSRVTAYDTITDFTHASDIIDVRGATTGGGVLLLHSGNLTSLYYNFVGGAFSDVVVAAGDIESTDVKVDAGVAFTIIGAAAAETLVGGAAADVLQGGGGADTLTGGAGADQFVYIALSDSTPTAFDTITDFTQGSDKIVLGALAGSLVGLFHDNSGSTGVFYGYSGGVAGGAILARLADVEPADISAPAGTAFAIVGSALAETLVGGAAGDLIQGGGGADALAGGGGADTFRYTALSDSNGAAYDTIYDFQHGTDKIDLTSISGGVVALSHFAGGLTGVFYAPSGGAAGGVILAYGDVEGPDLLASGPISLTITGTSAAEVLTGGAQADTLVGGGGADVLRGGGGADVFAYKAVSDSAIATPDYILDFQHGSDKIDLTTVAGGAVNIVHGGHGDSYVYFAPMGMAATGEIAVVGDVEQADLIVAAGTTVVITGAFAGPEPHATTDYGIF